MKQFFVILFVGLGCGVLRAQTINTDRPDQTESSAVVPAGSFQWECGFSSTWRPTFRRHIQGAGLAQFIVQGEPA